MDVLITGGQLIDGTGNPWTHADVGIDGDRFSRVAPAGRIDPSTARIVVDATGHVVCPGFIDIQSHSILPLLSDGRSLSKVTQGVTTEIMGELWTPAPFGGKRVAPVLPGFAEISPEDDRRARSWTRAVADRLGLRERGQVRPGFLADVVVFDPRTVTDRATFAEPHQLSAGIRDVWVNGQRVLANGAHTGARPGRPVYGPGRRN